VAFYAFKLTDVNVERPRGKIPDDDIVTFSVFVNQSERGSGAALFPDLPAGSDVPTSVVPVRSRRGVIGRDWTVGPLDIAPGDSVDMVYSGTNVSDSQLDLSDQSEIEIKILDSVLGAAVGEIGGPIGSLVVGALNWVSDPVGKFLGYKPQGPCNGLVFAGTVSFTGDALARLPYGPVLPWDGGLLDVAESSVTREHTDDATHNSDICGEVALTAVTVSVLRVPYVSVRTQNRWFFDADLRRGVRQLAPDPDAAHSLKALLRLTS
jgi:hypothetical protein